MNPQDKLVSAEQDEAAIQYAYLCYAREVLSTPAPANVEGDGR